MKTVFIESDSADNPSYLIVKHLRCKLGELLFNNCRFSAARWAWQAGGQAGRLDVQAYKLCVGRWQFPLRKLAEFLITLLLRAAR